MHRLARWLVTVLVAGSLAGCAAPIGLIYTNVTVPLDLDFDETPAQTRNGEGEWKTFSFYVQFDWDSAAIADAAREGGLTELWYADLEYLSVLGIWQERRAIVYGR